MELVLYYSTGDPRMKKQEMMMKSVLVRMGVKIRNVAPDQVMESVGYLAGVPGFEKREVLQQPEAEEKMPQILGTGAAGGCMMSGFMQLKDHGSNR